MKSVELKGILREELGKKTSKVLRRQEQVPCVLYGNGENVHFHAHERAFKEIVYTPNAYLVKINVDGKTYNSVLRDIQYHPVNDKIIHVDFFEVKEKEAVWMKIPVVLEGAAIGVLNGGRLVQKMRKVKIKALPNDLPDEIKVNISKLAIGKSIKIADLKFEGLEFLEPENAVVVLIKTARAVALTAEEAAEEAAEGEEGAEGETSGSEGGDNAPAEEAAE